MIGRTHRMEYVLVYQESGWTSDGPRYLQHERLGWAVILCNKQTDAINVALKKFCLTL